MPARSQAQARWALAGCPGSGMGPAKCSEFVPHGVGSMKALPEYTKHAAQSAAQRYAKARARSGR